MQLRSPGSARTVHAAAISAVAHGISGPVLYVSGSLHVTLVIMFRSFIFILGFLFDFFFFFIIEKKKTQKRLRKGFSKIKLFKNIFFNLLCVSCI